MEWIAAIDWRWYAAAAVVLAVLAVVNKRYRSELGTAGVVVVLLAIWSRLTESIDEPKPTTYQPPDHTEDHEETDAEITAIDDALADAHADAYDGAGSNVSDALDLLKEHDRENR